jgi:hypothetical protein
VERGRGCWAWEAWAALALSAEYTGILPVLCIQARSRALPRRRRRLCLRPEESSHSPGVYTQLPLPPPPSPYDQAPDVPTHVCGTADGLLTKPDTRFVVARDTPSGRRTQPQRGPRVDFYDGQNHSPHCAPDL